MYLQDTGDSRKFAVFCIVRVGSQIYDTALISPVDRHSTDVCFNDVLLFRNKLVRLMYLHNDLILECKWKKT